MKKILLIGLFCLSAFNLFGNAGIFRGSGTNLTLSESQELQMQSEIVRITPLPSDKLIDMSGRNSWWATYECEFTLKNLSDKDISARVGFPLSGDDRFSDGAKTIKNRDFDVFSCSSTGDDKKIYSVEYIPSDKEDKFSHIFYWDMQFKANETLKLYVNYKLSGYMGMASTLRKEYRSQFKDFPFYQKNLFTCLGQYFVYVTKTGNSWAGEIESAKFIFDLSKFDKSIEGKCPFDFAKGKSTYKPENIQKNLFKNGQYYRILSSEGNISFEDKGAELYVAEIAPFKPKADFALGYNFTLFPRNAKGLNYFMRAMEELYEIENERTKKLKTFKEKIFSEKDKSDLADIVLEFYGIPRDNESIKLFFESQRYSDPVYRPKIDEELKAKLLEISKTGKL